MRFALRAHPSAFGTSQTRETKGVTGALWVERKILQVLIKQFIPKDKYITLERNVTLAERVTILTHTNVGYKDHPLQMYFPSFTKQVVLEDGCFIGTNATILPGIKIGKCAFVCAGSIINKDVMPYHVVAGVPAKTIKVLK